MSHTHSQVIDAINVRISNRIFSPDLIEEGIHSQLMQNIDAMSLLSGVRFSFLENHPELFDRIRKENGDFEGAAHVILLSGEPHNLELLEKAGFYAERLILTATLMGLATSWVDKSIDLERACALARIPKNEVPYAALVVGYFKDQQHVLELSYEARAQLQRTHRGGQNLQALGGVTPESPSWYISAITAVSKAPFPAYKQPIRFLLSDDERSMRAFIDPDFSLGETRDHLILGIDKLHAHIGAQSDETAPVNGEWTWGNGGIYEIR
ncbi:nitroreductase family protein [Alloscardovia criceti]|uniref:nitroreductase family protein n=1 Tax=Alloscardovia criceti TaxID=356828 RepID=UPI00037CFA78|nr:nitroreductase family protein [Alloscardovia criceti]